MFNQFLEKFNESLDYFKKITNYEKTNFKVFFSNLFLYFLAFIVIAVVLDLNLISINNFFSISLVKPENFFVILLEGGYIYILNILVNLKMSFLDFLYNYPFFLFDDSYNSYVYSFLLNLSNQFKFYGKNNTLQSYYDYFIYDNELSYQFFNLEYLYSKKFKKIIILNSNLPIFFYFGIIFIITTLSSFILLSYLGLYGVFFINLISIILFWISSIFYFNSFYIDNCFYRFSLGK